MEMCIKYKVEYERMFREAERYRKKYDLVYQWMKLRQNGIKLEEFFYDRNLNSIALYGMGDLGRLIYSELKICGKVKCGIDRMAGPVWEELPIYSLNSIQQKVDTILVTPVLITDEIEDEIYDVLGEQTVFVFEELLYELSRKHGITSELWPV